MAVRFRSLSCGADGHVHSLKSRVENYYCQRTRSLMNVGDKCAHFSYGSVNNRLNNSELTKFCLYRKCMPYSLVSTCHPCPRQYIKPTCFLRQCGYYNKHFRCCLPGVINRPRNYCIIPKNKKVSKIQVHTGSYEINDQSNRTKIINTEKRNKESKKNDTKPSPTKAKGIMNDDTNTEKRPLDGQGDDESKSKSIKKKRKKTKKKKKMKKINQLTNIDGDLISNESVAIQTSVLSVPPETQKDECCCQQETRCYCCCQRDNCCCCCCQREKRCCCCCQRGQRCCCLCQRDERCSCCCQREKRCCCCQLAPIALSCRKLAENSTYPSKCCYHKAQHKSRYENFLIWRRKRRCNSQCLLISQK
ncbi:hypothetical protein WA026_010998 [Henosepilachna vigintioctopunctata]|uniref:Uncharacterized protein n=1 Tax=Henosepilachna vigintioctopunctata TaxID=420089 RepID=A0AAW1USL3_9CUCU